MNDKKFLSELIKEDKIEFALSNLILSPVGSGKTNFITKELVPKYKRILYLCDTTNLKEQQEMENVAQGIEITCLCYNNLGLRINYTNDFIIEGGYDCIVCHEFHQLFRYDNKFNSKATSHVIKLLLARHKNVHKYFLTATPKEYYDTVEQQRINVSHIKEIDYLHDSRIMRYITYFGNSYLHNFREIPHSIKDHLKQIIKDDHRVLVFAKRIDTLKKIEQGINKLEIKELRPICLWSIHNLEKPMSDEQLMVRDYLLNNHTIPEEYNILLINSSMETGINIKDERFQYCYINDYDETTQTQVRGRLRHNIWESYIISNTKDPIEQIIEEYESGELDVKNTRELQIIRKYCDRKLFTQDKNLLCEDLHKYDTEGRLVKWTRLKKIIEALGFKVQDGRCKIKGKQIRYSIITE